MVLVVLSGALVALATVALVLGLVTDGGLSLVGASVVASLAAAVLLLRHRRAVLSSA